MPIMPLRKSLRGNSNERNKELEQKESRVHKRKRTGDSTDKDKILMRINNSGSPKRKVRRSYRGSSGTRAERYSLDRAKRVEEYERKKKCDENNHDRKETTSQSRNDEDASKASQSRKASQDNHSRRSSPSQNANSTNNNNDESSPAIETSSEGHLRPIMGDWLRKRFKIHKLLGRGTFGKCFECYDKKHDRIVALKVIRSHQKYRDAAELEIDTLKRLKKKDPDNKNFCIDLYGAFHYHGHVCITFPKFGQSVFAFMKDNLFHPFPPSHVKRISCQLITAVKFLHSLKLTHTDLKPENMLFVDSSYTSHYSENAKQNVHVLKSPDIRLIDFGSATYETEHHSTIVSTRHFRAPEVILELGWTYPCDMWSCGCIIYELFKGCLLFETHDDLEHLAMMERTLGTIPKHMVKKTRRLNYFKNESLDWNKKSRDGRYVEANYRPLKENIVTSDRRTRRDLYDLLQGLLAYDPNERTTASKALQNPYFTGDDATF